MATDDPSPNFFDLEIKTLIPEDEMKTLIPDDELGEKLYGAVHRVTGAAYLVKSFSAYNPADLPEIRREIQLAKRLNHPNLMKCFEVFGMDVPICFLLEHVDGGSLASHDVSDESSLAAIFHQVLLALDHLHENNISHGDIRPSNIFIDSKERVKLLYLGKILANKTTPFAGTGAVHDEFSWDLWSVGFCILKLYRDLRWQFKLTKVSIELWNFLFCCMQRQQTFMSNGWKIKQLLQHPYFDRLSVIPQQKRAMDFRVALSSKSASAHSSQSTILDVDASPYAASEATSSHEVEKISSKAKKSKIFMGVEQQIYKVVESSEDPTQIVPHVLWRCIQHCVLFLSDCEFEKDKLLHMWIAEECIEFEERKIVEDVAKSYFDELVRQEVIIPSKFDHLYRLMKYKINASKVADRFLGQGNYIRINESNRDKIHGEALHVVWQCKKLDQTLVDTLKNLKQLRTLLVLVDCSVLNKHLPNDIFFGLKLLRTLDLSCSHVLELPGSIGLLEALRYLDISENPIKRLPQSIDCLLFLQTLNLRGCIGLSALPKGLGRLINLRHLDLNIVGQLEFMPSGMGNLVKLQTLQAFIVGKNDGCGIGELKGMNEISGSFCISRIENVSSAEEAKKASLSDKKRIDKLELRWQDYGNENSEDTATEVLECLQPHFHLRELQITHYSGLKLPSWISNPLYTDLSSITLYKCINCDILPSMGELPSLKILHIVEMKSLKNITNLFCGDYGIQSSSAFFKFEKAFPTLEKLTLENMLDLEEWTGIRDGDFPRLSHISIRHCPKLSVLPSLSYLGALRHLEINHCMQLLSLPEGILPASLESLIIKGCPNINERCLKDGGQDWFKIADVKNIWIDFEKISLD